ncbi:hypothetical protein BO86DRAFT_381829 [Aspergillus japonicus CBS 114.51]|uniref:Mitochondrial cytochrome b2 n=1 Tax=Aspergillus japonicus CBS 114.51 TaxID=1448312 RepID=A0A8T8WTA9_ASPJA|nr:hypothetical protein BO86DRAFT_381829 [Aspergillus japonicus CBS 114.51]RAH78910.1 hypothetical protein BO86DRAFT_381829 [Aspergillus japonicus CBS 114.51]
MFARTVSAKEVETHSRETDIWIVVNGKVYDVTEFAPTHPGGAQIIYQYAGKDASVEYNSAHSSSLIATELHGSCIGELDTSTVPPSWLTSVATEAAPTHSPQTPRHPPPLSEALSLKDFEKIARDQLSPKSWAFNSGAANDNLTRDANQTMLQRIWLRPAIMRDVSAVTTRRTLLGCRFTVPIYIAPVGAAKSVWVEGELPLARAAYQAGIVQCIATTASHSLAEILDATPEQAWLQVYINRDRSRTEAQIRQATVSGKVKGFLITADLPVMSKREADERLKPDGGRGLVVSLNQQQPRGAPPMNGNAGLAKSNSSFIDSTLNWKDIPWLRSLTELPLLIKGVQRAEDAHLALRFGLDGIVVSNHGGRAADTAPPSILTLLEIRRDCPEAFEKMVVLVDGGFRRGSDVVKAVCLGASAVGLGRPFTYALTYGEPGVLHAIEVLKQEVETAMQLVGLTDLQDASPRYINTAALDRLLPPNNSLLPEELAADWARVKL